MYRGCHGEQAPGNASPENGSHTQGLTCNTMEGRISWRQNLGQFTVCSGKAAGSMMSLLIPEVADGSLTH